MLEHLQKSKATFLKSKNVLEKTLSADNQQETFFKKEWDPQRLYVGPIEYIGMIESDLIGDYETFITFEKRKRVILNRL